MWPRHFNTHEIEVRSGFEADPREVMCNCRACLVERTPRVELFTDVRLSEWPHDSARFAVLGDGTIVLGDTRTVLHADIMLCGTHFGCGDPMIFGALQSHRGRSWEICYLQPVIPRSDEGAMLLLSRLSTWRDLIGQLDVILRDIDARLKDFVC